MAADRKAHEKETAQQSAQTALHKVLREVLSWVWLLLALFVVEGAVAQSRLIPSGSMENTILVGDHIVVSPFGYSLCIPYTELHVPLWRDPKRQQIIILESPVNGSEDLIKRVIGIPGDRIQIDHGFVYVNGMKLNEPYVLRDPSDSDGSLENFPPAENPLYEPGLTPRWASTLRSHVVDGKLVVPPGDYFVMGDNRGDSYDSRYWGFVPRKNIIAEPLFIFMSINASEDAWQPGHIGERIGAYLNIFVHPSEVRWGRLFHPL
ncbi:MAG: signal peptidase I [Candidatus Acidiferrales bacterium]